MCLAPRCLVAWPCVDFVQLMMWSYYHSYGLRWVVYVTVYLIGLVILWNIFLGPRPPGGVDYDD